MNKENKNQQRHIPGCVCAICEYRTEHGRAILGELPKQPTKLHTVYPPTWKYTSSKTSIIFHPACIIRQGNRNL